MKPSKQRILAERLRRQALIKPVDNMADYLRLFRLLQPVSTIAFCRPGDPPSLTPRSDFDDRKETDRLRHGRIIVKARFLSGTVGYVFSKDLAAFAASFQKPVSRLNFTQQKVLETIRRLCPITASQIKEETGLLNKKVGPALHRLQQAFEVYEDQVDDGWDRAWYDFPSEWPDIDIKKIDSSEAFLTVVRSFLQAHVFATAEQVTDWSGKSRKEVGKAVGELENEGKIIRADIKCLGDGWLCGRIPETPAIGNRRKVIMLNKNDLLVRSHKSELKVRFGGKETLHYLLIDGTFRGAVIGHWGRNPYDVDDVVVELSRGEAEERKHEILNEVAGVYHPPCNTIRRYQGKKLPVYR